MTSGPWTFSRLSTSQSFSVLDVLFAPVSDAIQSSADSKGHLSVCPGNIFSEFEIPVLNRETGNSFGIGPERNELCSPLY